MTMTKKIWIIVGLVVLILILWIAGTYNRFVGLNTTVDKQWADIQTQYQRRVDLIPNLKNIVEVAAGFEQSTLLAVTEARTQWLNAKETPGNTDDISAARSFDGALARLLVTVENYPQLRATESFRDFMAQLEGTENRIAVARERYNGGVLEMNTAVKRFPSVLIARMFGFDARTFFEAAAGSGNAPEVKFNFGK